MSNSLQNTHNYTNTLFVATIMLRMLTSIAVSAIIKVLIELSDILTYKAKQIFINTLIRFALKGKI